MRLPNGYGGVSKLPGKRRRPWRVRRTLGWEITPEGQNRQKTQNIGFYATKAEALAALAAYNAHPYSCDVTFEQVYERATPDRFDGLGENSVFRYNLAFRRCEKLHKRRFVELRLADYQAIVDGISGVCAQQSFKIMLQMMYDYAIRNEIIDRSQNNIEYLKLSKVEAKTPIHYRFSRDEMTRLWNAADNPIVQEILMLIYSGVRPGELYGLDTAVVNLSERSFRIVKGKNANAIRTVPIHHKTLPFFESRVAAGNEMLIPASVEKGGFLRSHGVFLRKTWYPTLEAVGALEYVNDDGETMRHLPDDTRHTFATMWMEQKLNEVYRRRIQGHSGKGVGESFYTHISFDELRDELDRLE